MNRWMTDNWSKLENLRLSEIYIPGTHNSFAYTTSFDKNTTFYKNLELAYNVIGYFPEITENFTLNQDLTVYEQLNIGIRILDLRISFYDDVYYCSHTFYCTTLLDILSQITKFMTENPNEFLIIRYKKDRNHKKTNTKFSVYNLNKYLLTVLGSLNINQESVRVDDDFGVYTNKKTLKEMFTNSGKLLLFYNNQGLKTDWYDTPDLAKFTDKYEKHVLGLGQDSDLVLLDVVLTPNTEYIVKLIIITVIFSLILLISMLAYIRRHNSFGFGGEGMRYIEIILGSIILYVILLYYFIVILFRHFSLKYNAARVNSLIMSELDSDKENYRMFSFDFVNKEIAKKVIDKNFE